MRSPWRRAACVCVAAAGLAGSACASATVIPLRGAVADLSALVGEWNGTYASRELGRNGTLWLKLVAGEEHAHGDVRMTPRGGLAPYGRFGPDDPRTRPPVEFLTVRFIRVSATDVEGTLDQYWDPDCRCWANTTFRGRLYGDRLEGTFETRLATGAVAHGRWKALRRPPAVALLGSQCDDRIDGRGPALRACATSARSRIMH